MYKIIFLFYWNKWGSEFIWILLMYEVKINIEALSHGFKYMRTPVSLCPLGWRSREPASRPGEPTGIVESRQPAPGHRQGETSHTWCTL